MSRSHAWIRRGEELIDPRPMNWGTSLTMIGAMRLSGWITMRTIFKTANADRFVRWVRECLVPKLKFGDVIILDNAKPHHDRRVVELIERAHARVEYLPPYSPDFNPIESGWALTKQHIKAVAPRDRTVLRKTAHAGRRRVRPHHCRAWFAHAGYRRRLN
jgi:transposase